MTGNYYRPLMHVLNYAIWHGLGPHAAWFHVVALLLHGAVSVLVMLVIGRISGRPDVGFIAALLFAVHPAHSEVLAWIACSPELMASLFTLAAILIYVHSAESRARGIRRAAFAAATAICALLAALSKEIGLATPLLLVAYELLVRRRLRDRLPELAALAVGAAAYLALRSAALGGLMPVRHDIELAPLHWLWTALTVFWRCFVMLAWPVQLNFFHYDAVSRSFFEPAVIAGAFTLFGLLTYFVWSRSLAVPLLLLPLAPMFLLPNLYIGQMWLERSAYLPSVGFVWLLGVLIQRQRLKYVLAVVLISYAARSAARLNDWRDEVDFFNEGLAHAPNAAHLHLWRADVLWRHDRPVEAAASLEHAIRVREDYVTAHNHLGRAYARLGRTEEALSEYHRAAALAVQEGPESAARPWNNIGALHRSIGQLDPAISAYRRALELDPRFAAARNNLGFALLVAGRLDEAFGELQTAVAQAPDLAPAQSNLGLAYAMRGDLGSALTTLERALRLSPDNAEVHARIGEVHLARGETVRARQCFERALALEPNNPRAQAGRHAVTPPVRAH